MNRVREYFHRNYGTERGYIRYLLSVLEYRLGSSRRFNNPDLGKVRRVVFVCMGNICRSSYGHHYAAPILPIEVASFGLSTVSNLPAFELAQKVSLQRGLDLSAHKTTDISDFDMLPGDLLLVMEVRQARRLARIVAPREDVQISLLGNWASPLRPHIHDPHSLTEAYFDSCFQVIESSIRNLKAMLENRQAK